jgi:predicted phosphodiesterase
LQLTDALIAGVSTSGGVELRQAIKDPKNAARRGRLDRTEARRIRDLMARAEPHQARVAVMHHHAIDLGPAARNALSNASQAIQWMVEAEVDIILCGHAHQHRADTLHDIVVSVAGTVSTRTPEGIASSFHRIVIEGDSVQVELYLWERDHGRFRRTDVSVFPRHRAQRDNRLATGTL